MVSLPALQGGTVFVFRPMAASFNNAQVVAADILTIESQRKQ
jgi:hypothetical protein